MSKLYEYLSYDQMHGYYAEVIRELTMDGLVPSLVITPLRGGSDFGVKLSQYYNAALVAMRWQNGKASTGGTDAQVIADALSQLPNGSVVLVVDDICDSGTTFKTLSDMIRMWPQHTTRLRFVSASAINNVDVRACDYGGREISRRDDPQWFVFPWEEWWKPRSR